MASGAYSVTDENTSMELSLSTIPDLTAYVTKQGAYPAAHGGFADIWMCTLNNEAYPSIAQNVGRWFVALNTSTYSLFHFDY